MSQAKEFEAKFKEQCEEYGAAIIRLYDTTSGFVGISNPCDYIIYNYPNIFFLELKSTQDNTLNFKSDIRENQWKGLLKLQACDTKNIVAGVLCWYIKHKIVQYFPIEYLETLRLAEVKSVRFDKGLLIPSKTKQIYPKMDIGYLLTEGAKFLK